MNPTVPVDIIAAAYSEDKTAAAAEYGAEFRGGHRVVRVH
jgi:hypothetical protein